uniref:Uncharacterized protein n=1 Tax=Romanomermis culicivorax TaxID=13658 RepID=A0A915IZX1_ROMCU
MVAKASLDQIQKSKLHQFLLAYHPAFSLEGDPPTLTHLVQHTIDTGDARPVTKHYYGAPIQQYHIVREHIQDMLNKQQQIIDGQQKDQTLIKSGESGVPLCHALLPSKQRVVYNQLFNCLIEALMLRFCGIGALHTIIMDFETAAHQAVFLPKCFNAYVKSKTMINLRIHGSMAISTFSGDRYPCVAFLEMDPKQALRTAAGYI